MMKERCSNMNHGRTPALVSFCPTCGEGFKAALRRACGNTEHASQRKNRNSFCSACGLKLR